MPIKAPRPCSWGGCSTLTTRGYLCEYHQSQRQHQRDREHERKTSRMYYHTAQWLHLRRMVLHRDPLCMWPDGCVSASVDVDHIVPRYAGGSDSMQNLQGLCHQHHALKTALDNGAFGNKKSKNV